MILRGAVSAGLRLDGTEEKAWVEGPYDGNPADIRRLPGLPDRAARIGFVASWLILAARVHTAIVVNVMLPHNAIESSR